MPHNSVTTPEPSSASKKRKPQSSSQLSNQNPAPTSHSHTIRSLPHTYIHLSLLSNPPSTDTVPIDALTARGHLTSALHQFLGVTGTAISIDILKLEGREVWIRVPREDSKAVVEAVSGWVGGGDGERVAWRVMGRGEWLGAVIRGGGRELYET